MTLLRFFTDGYWLFIVLIGLAFVLAKILWNAMRAG